MLLAPTNFHLMNTTNSSVLLGSWDASDLSSVESYLVYCRVTQNQYYLYQEPAEELEFKPVAMTTVNMATITGLQPFTIYQCQVRAVDSNGEGPPSDTSMARTSEGMPSAPTNLTAPAVTANSITLSWSRPDMPNGIVSVYSIQIYTLPSNITTFTLSPNAAVMFFTIGDLFPYTSYSVLVSASTSAGFGEPAQVNIVTDPIREFGALTASTLLTRLFCKCHARTSCCISVMHFHA